MGIRFFVSAMILAAAVAANVAAAAPAPTTRARCERAVKAFARDYDDGKRFLYELAWDHDDKRVRERAEDLVFAIRPEHAVVPALALQCCRRAGSPFACLGTAFRLRVRAPAVAR
jgi:hypothetical protein